MRRKTFGAAASVTGETGDVLLSFDTELAQFNDYHSKGSGSIPLIESGEWGAEFISYEIIEGGKDNPKERKLSSSTLRLMVGAVEGKNFRSNRIILTPVPGVGIYCKVTELNYRCKESEVEVSTTAELDAAMVSYKKTQPVPESSPGRRP